MVDEVYILLDSTYSTDAATCDRDISNPSFMDECTATGTTPFAAGNYYKTVEDSKRLSLNLMTEHIDTGLMQYGSGEPDLEWTLGTYDGDLAGMEGAFANLKWKAHFQTELAPAINKAVGLFTQTGGKKKSLVIVTDGKYQDGDDAVNAAQLARAKGVALWIFAWGPRVFNDQTEALPHFVALTGSKDQVLIVNDPAGVSQWLDVSRLCTTLSPTPSPAAPDEGFDWLLIIYVVVGVIVALLLLVFTMKSSKEIERKPVQANPGVEMPGEAPIQIVSLSPVLEESFGRMNEAPIGTPPKPVFYPNGGTFTGILYLHISSNNDSHAEIRYTVDGGLPTEASPLYTGKPILIGTLGNEDRLEFEMKRDLAGPISVLDTTSDEFVVRAVAFHAGEYSGGRSDVAIARFHGAQSVSRLSPGQHGQFVASTPQLVASSSQPIGGAARPASPMLYPPVLE
jgi:hypothetical protein